MQTLFTTMKVQLSHSCNPTARPSHITYTFTPPPSISKVNSISTTVNNSPCLHLQHCFTDIKSIRHTDLSQRKVKVLPPWRYAWWPRWERPGTWPGIQSGLQRMVRFLGYETKDKHLYTRMEDHWESRHTLKMCVIGTTGSFLIFCLGIFLV